MKTMPLFLSCLFLTVVLFLPNAPAQDYTRWGLPKGAIARIGKGRIFGNIAYSPDGTQLAIASAAGIWIYDAHTGKELDLLITEPQKDMRLMNSIAYSPNGRTLATGISGNKVYLWDAETWEHKTTFIVPTEYRVVNIHSIVYSPDGTTLATQDGSKAYLWDAETWEHKTTLIEHALDIRSLIYSPDGKTIATAGPSGVYLWDANTGKCKAILKGHSNWWITSLAYSPDGKTIATITPLDTIRLWDSNTGKEKKKLELHKGIVDSIVYSPDGTTLATAIGNEVHLWDANLAKSKNTLKGHSDGIAGRIHSFVYSPDGKTIATASQSEVRLWDADTGKNISTLRHTSPEHPVTYSPNGKTIATAIAPRFDRRSDETICSWNAIIGKEEKIYKNHKKNSFRPVKSLAYSPDGKSIAAQIKSEGHFENEVHFWDVGTGKQHETILKFDVSVLRSSIAYSPDGKTIATPSKSNVLLWYSDTGNLKSTLKGHTEAVLSVAYSPDGKTIATASQSEVRLWNTDTGKYKNALIKGHTQGIISVAYSPDGKTIITASKGGSKDEVRLWGADTGKHKRTLKGYTSLVYSPDGKTIATVRKGEARLWDATMGKYTTISELYARETPVYSPDGKTIAISSRGSLFLYNTRVLASQIPQWPSSLTEDDQQLLDRLQPPQPSIPIQQITTPQTPQQIAKSALASTVLIVMENADGQFLRTGSGFFVKRGIIATNLHVVEGVFKGYVKQVSVNKAYRIKSIVAMDMRQDLALIEVSNVSAPILSIGRSDKVQIGESVYVAGNPIGFLEGTFSNGIVSGVREFQVGTERIQITAPISEGSSGGPVLNSRGEVIGVAASIITAGQNLNFAIPSNYLSELLSKVSGRK